MSKSFPATICCPECSNNFSVNIWGSVNNKTFPDLSQRVIEGTFFDVVCPSCGHTFEINYDVLYHDLDRDIWIYVVNDNPKDNGDYRRRMAEAGKAIDEVQRLFGNVMCRIVSSKDELREKVAAVEAGRDDRVIELYKVLLAKDASNKVSGLTCKLAFYTYQSGVEVIILYGSDGKEYHCKITDELYNAVKGKYQAELLKPENMNRHNYNKNWANSLISQS